MNLKKWQTLVRRLSRLFYAEPLYYLLIDYLIEHTFVEKQTFAQQHSLESSTKKIEGRCWTMRWRIFACAWTVVLHSLPPSF